MAIELQQLPNPDNVPGAVTSGYQRQNTNLFVLQMGLDTTEPYDNGTGEISIPEGGIVEVNGVLYKLVSDITLQKPEVNTCYWIAIDINNEGTATCSLVTRSGIWDSSKKGCYTLDNKRTLNWVSLDQTSYSGLPLTKAFHTKGIHAWRGKTGWYYIILKSGLGGGNGSGRNYGGSGVPNQYTMKQFPYFLDGFYTNTIKIGSNEYNGGRGGSGGAESGGAEGNGGGGAQGADGGNISDGDTACGIWEVYIL